MITSKERSVLRSIAQNIEPITQLGKSGVNESFIDGIKKAIDKRELIKITVLENSGLEPKEAGYIISEMINAEFVCVTGRKLVFYRRSDRENINHIEF